MTSRAGKPSLASLSVLVLAIATIGVGGTARAVAACRPLPPDIAGWWSGEDDTQDRTLAASHGQPVGGVVFGPGVIGRAFDLDGVDDRIDVPDAPHLRPERFTLAAWVRVDVGSEWACIICKQYGGGNFDSYTLWLNLGVLQGGMFGYAEAVAPTPLPVGTTVHVAVTYDGSNILLYSDGALVATANGPASPVPYDGNQVIIGAEDNGVNAYTAHFNGMIDEPQIFSRALSGCEIRSLYTARASGHCVGDADGDLLPDFHDNCPEASNAGQLDTDADGAGDACDCAPADAGVQSIDETHELAFARKGVPDWCLDPSSTGSDTVYDAIRGDLADLPVAGSAAVCRSGCTAPMSGLVGWWSGDGNGSDLVGGHHGALENGAGFASGWTREAFAFDGVNDRVRTGNVALGDEFTVAAWVKSTRANQTGHRRIVETSFSTHFALTTGNPGTDYKFIVRSPASPYGTVHGGRIVPGEWQLVVGTYDGTTGILYVDGEAVASGAFTAPAPVNLPVNIGAYTAGGFGWAGLIDEVQIYDRALTAGEVWALYEAGSAGWCKAALGGQDAEWAAPWAADGSVPEPGAGFWYLYRAGNGCGVGTYGLASDGSERVSPACE